MATDFRDIVVSLTVERADGKAEHGFGFAVGRVINRGGSSSVLIVTANHILRPPGSSQQPSRVEVRYFFDRGAVHLATSLNLFESSTDIGFIAAPYVYSQPKPGLEVANCPTALQSYQPIWYIGRSAEWYKPKEAGVYVGTTGSGAISVDQLAIIPGSSGAPVVSSDGIIGMVITDTGVGRTSRQASIERIKQLVTEKHTDLVWALQTSCGCVQDMSEKCTSPELRDLVASALKPGIPQYDVIKRFEATRGDLMAIFDARDVEVAAAHYKESVQFIATSDNRRVRYLPDADIKAHLPKCFRIPRGYTDKLHKLRLNPNRSITYCDVPITWRQNGEQRGVVGPFLKADTGWVWLTGFPNWLWTVRN